MATATPEPHPSPGSAWSMPRGLIVLLSTAAAVVAIGGIKGFAGVIGPVFLALMLTVAVQPIQSWVQRRGWPAWVGMALALIVVYALLIAMVGALIVCVAQLATELPGYSEQFGDLLDSARSALERFGVGGTPIRDALSGFDFGKLLALVEGLLNSLAGLLSNLFFVVALLMFMVFDGMTMPRRVEFVSRVRPDIAYALNSFAAGTRQYLLVSTVFGLIVAVFDGALLWWLGVPLPLLWALLSFITNYIPNVGFVIGLIPPALLALLEGGPSLMIWVIVLYSVVNFVIQSVIQPKFVGDAVGLGITVTFLALVFWSWVLGALGALLAIPLTLLAKALLLDIDPSTRWVDILIGERPEPRLENPSAASDQ